MTTPLAAPRRASRFGWLLAALSLPVALAAAPPAHAASADLLISEVYGGGGNSGAVLTNDFIELANAGTAPLSLDGYSVHPVPLTTMTLTSVSQAELPTASGLFNVVRNVGGSVGIAVTTTWLSRQTRVHLSTLIAHVTPWSAATADRLARLQDVYLGAGVDADTARRQALRHLYDEIERQASMKAFGDDFLRLAALFAAVVPVIWLMRRQSATPRPQPAEIEAV